MASPRKINAISLEFNNCYYNGGFQFYRQDRFELGDQNALLKANDLFLDKLAKKIAARNANDEGIEKAYVFNGSTRQDAFTDRSDTWQFPQTPSVVYGFRRFAGELGLRAVDQGSNTPMIQDELLLGDVFYQYPPDQDERDDNTFEAIENSLKENGEFNEHFIQQVNKKNKALEDESYVLTLYAQMHKVASQNPNDDIEFDYYHGEESALNRLDLFFKQHRELIPGNVKLNLNLYKGQYDPENFIDDNNHDDLRSVQEELLISGMPPGIQGRGAIDYNFKRNAYRLAIAAGVNVPTVLASDNRTCNIANALLNNPKALRNFIKRRDLAGKILNEDNSLKKRLDNERLNGMHNAEIAFLNGGFNPYLMIKDLRDEIDALKDSMADQIALQQNSEFVTALNILCEEIASDLTEQVKNGVSPVLIRQSHAMQVAKNTQRLVSDLQNNELDQNSKLDLIDSYMKNNQKKSGFLKNFFKGVAVVAIAAAGFVAGAVIGAGIGIAAGAWSGPGAAVTGLAGLFTGAITGAAAGVAAGAAVTGLGAGALSAWLLFRKDQISKGVTNVGEKSKLFQPALPAEEMRLEPGRDRENALVLK